MATTALATVSRSEFSLFSEDELLKEAVDSVGENITPANLIRVKVPTAGGKRWTVETAAGEETVDKIEGILVFVQKHGVLWPSVEMEDGSQPVLVTWDLQVAEQVGPIPPDIERQIAPYKIGEKTYDWAKMTSKEGPFGFGSGKNGHGKRVKEGRMLFILRPNEIYPVVVNAPPGSLSAVTNFLIQIPNVTRAPYWHCQVSLGLEQDKSAGGQVFSRIVPRIVGKLSPEDGAAVKNTFHGVLGQVARQLSDEQPAD